MRAGYRLPSRNLAAVKERFVFVGTDTASSTPDEIAAFLRAEQDRYAAVVRNANIKIEQ